MVTLSGYQLTAGSATGIGKSTVGDQERRRLRQSRRGGGGPRLGGGRPAPERQLPGFTRPLLAGPSPPGPLPPVPLPPGPLPPGPLLRRLRVAGRGTAGSGRTAAAAAGRGRGTPPASWWWPRSGRRYPGWRRPGSPAGRRPGVADDHRAGGSCWSSCCSTRNSRDRCRAAGQRLVVAGRLGRAQAQAVLELRPVLIVSLRPATEGVTGWTLRVSGGRRQQPAARSLQPARGCGWCLRWPTTRWPASCRAGGAGVRARRGVGDRQPDRLGELGQHEAVLGAELLAGRLGVLGVAEPHEGHRGVAAAQPLLDLRRHGPVGENQPGPGALAGVGQPVEQITAQPVRAEHEQRVLPRRPGRAARSAWVMRDGQVGAEHLALDRARAWPTATTRSGLRGSGTSAVPVAASLRSWDSSTQARSITMRSAAPRPNSTVSRSTCSALISPAAMSWRGSPTWARTRSAAATRPPWPCRRARR